MFQRSQPAVRLTALAAVLALAACDNDDSKPPSDTPLTLSPARVHVANNGSSNSGTVDQRNKNYALETGFDSGTNEGLALDRADNLIQAGDGAAVVGLRTFCAVDGRMDAFDAQSDREITGVSTTLVNPKGIALDDANGTIIVANFNAMNLLVFGSAAAGDVAPIATTPLSGNAWDMTYDASNDRLYVALTNGTVAVFDDYAANDYVGLANRTLVPSDDTGAQISVNLHGIAFEAVSDRLVVSDVGSASVDDDGAIFVLDSASTATGPVVPSRAIAGASTRLGNPVDIVLDGDHLRVAEKAQNALLVFGDIFDGDSGDIAPDLVVDATAPESLAVRLDSEMTPDGITDLTDADLLAAVAISSNVPAGDIPMLEPARHYVDRLDPALSATLAEFDLDGTLENITFDLNGDGYLAFIDEVDGPGIAVIGRLAAKRDGGAFETARDRLISGEATGLIAPKGIAIMDQLGALLVADIGTSGDDAGIPVFGACAAGNVAPVAVVDTDGGRPWDLDYDAVTDRLFAAFTNGTVGVYDQFSSKWGQSGPDRLITPSDAGGMQVSVNLHGVHYDRTSGALILSDVGAAGDATDGQLFVIPSASMASGNVAVSVQIGGASSMLGNPVDISFDGSNLYVAEKANGMVLMFANLLSAASGDVAPDAALTRSLPESVALIPDYLSVD